MTTKRDDRTDAEMAELLTRYIWHSGDHSAPHAALTELTTRLAWQREVAQTWFEHAENHGELTDRVQRLEAALAESRAEYRGAVMVVWLLLMRLGGRATITNLDILDAEHSTVEVSDDPASFGGRVYRALAAKEADSDE